MPENTFKPWAIKFDTLEMVNTALKATEEYFGPVIPSSDQDVFIDTAIKDSDKNWITKSLAYSTGAFTSVSREKLKVFLGTTHQWSASKLRENKLWIGNPSDPYPCSQGINDAYCADKNLVLLIYSDIYAPNSTYGWDIGRMSTPAHEVFHTIQFALAGPSVGPDDKRHIPRWLIEGSANFFGFYVADKLNFDRYIVGRNNQIRDNRAYKTVVPLEKYDTFGDLDPYGIGQAATEYLIASIGFRDFLNIFIYTKTEGSFESGFKKATSLSISDFYSLFENARSSMQIGG